MNHLHKALVLLSVIAVPAAAHTYFAAPEGLCFASGTATYRMSPAATAPDYRVRVESHAARPDLRMQMVDSPELADFVLADDFAPAEGNACRSPTPAKTIRVDAEAKTSDMAPDVTVTLNAEAVNPDYKIYVHSVRFSHQDAAALLAVMWKVTQKRKLAERR
jgi:hypothetical protein